MIPEQYFAKEMPEPPITYTYTYTVTDNLGTYPLEEWQAKGPDHVRRCRQKADLDMILMMQDVARNPYGVYLTSSPEARRSLWSRIKECLT